jgi:hypothetical protein
MTTHERGGKGDYGQLTPASEEFYHKFITKLGSSFHIVHPQCNGSAKNGRDCPNEHSNDRT